MGGVLYPFPFEAHDTDKLNIPPSSLVSTEEKISGVTEDSDNDIHLPM
jgi:hypothetical protein